MTVHVGNGKVTRRGLVFAVWADDSDELTIAIAATGTEDELAVGRNRVRAGSANDPLMFAEMAAQALREYLRSQPGAS